MTGNVVQFTGVTTLDLAPDSVLSAALAANLSAVVVVGFDADGMEYFASSVADGADALWHLERAKWRLMREVDAAVEGEE